MARFHILDAQPFRQSYKLGFEILHISRRLKLSCAAVSYWYGDELTVAKLPNLEDAMLRAPERHKMVPLKDLGAGELLIEGEDMKVIEYDGPTIYHQDTSDIGSARFVPNLPTARYFWSGEKQLLWNGQRPGARLLLGFKARPGRYKLIARFSRFKNYGLHDLSVNDGAAVQVDLCSPVVMVPGEEELGLFELGENNTLKVVVKGTRSSEPRRLKPYVFGLDCLRLVPQP